MKVAITGANGFIGKNLVSSLKNEHDVLALTRSDAKNKYANVKWVRTDYSAEELQRLLHGNDVVIHLAAQRPYRGNHAIDNIFLDYRVFEAAKAVGVNHVIFVSTRGVYGEQPGPWTEFTPPAPKSFYALAKLQSEVTADYFARQGICVTILRLSQVFGVGEYEEGALTTFLHNAFSGKPIVLSVKGIKREYIYIDDVSEAVKKVLVNPVTGIFNLGSGDVISIEEMASCILSAFGRNDLPVLSDEMKEINEYSLMNSEKFREHFSWQPVYQFPDAAEEVAKLIREQSK